MEENDGSQGKLHIHGWEPGRVNQVLGVGSQNWYSGAEGKVEMPVSVCKWREREELDRLMQGSKRVKEPGVWAHGESGRLRVGGHHRGRMPGSG